MSSIVSPVLCLQVIRHSLKEKKGGDVGKGVVFSMQRGGGRRRSILLLVHLGRKGEGGDV